MNELTDLQKKALAFIREYIEKNSYPPSQKEIGVHLGRTATGAARPHLLALEKKGYIKFELNKARCIQLLSPAFADDNS